MSKIQKELAKATEIDPKRGETINDESYKKRLIVGVGDLSDKQWDSLSEESQNWYNENADLINAKKSLPEGWPDEEPEAKPEAGRRRVRASDDDAKPSAKEYKPAKGDTVKVTTKRGKTYEGKILDPDDKGELVLEVDNEEVGVGLDRIESIEPVGQDKPEASSRRRRAADDEPEEPADPKVGDTVEVINSRDKIVVGNIVELDDKIVVVKDATGDEIEFSRDRIKSIKVKVTAEAGGRSKAKADPKDDAGDGKRRTTKADNGGVSVTTRVRELICDEPNHTREQIAAALKKEGLECKENTLHLIYADSQKLFAMLRERKLMK